MEKCWGSFRIWVGSIIRILVTFEVCEGGSVKTEVVNTIFIILYVPINKILSVKTD